MSTFQVGCIFGSLFTFPLVERFGRRKGMILASMVFCLGAGIMVKIKSFGSLREYRTNFHSQQTGSAGRLPFIYAGRAITGLGIGSASLIVRKLMLFLKPCIFSDWPPKLTSGA